MEGITNRPQSMLSPQQNIAVSSPYGLQQSQDKMPPSYEEAHIAVQSMENEKVAIYRHPLFPLLAMLLEKCEHATQTSDCPTSDAFDNDIKNFMMQHNREGKPCFSGDQELDNLIIKAIQVFRIHLLELEKVNELCKDFCQRYIACLKGKMQSENLLRSPMSTTFQTPSIGCVSQSFQQLPSAQPQQTFIQQAQLLAPQDVAYYTTSPCTIAMATPPNISVIATQVQQQQASPMSYTPQQSATVVVTAATAATPIVTPTGQTVLLAQMPQQQQHIVPASVTYSTPSSIVVTTPTTPTSSGAGSPTEIALPTALPMPALDSPTDSNDRSKKSKRGVLPKQATSIMKTWLFQHIMHPYPTEDEKRSIAQQTNLTILQVNNWFINARRRILQPMLDAGNPEAHKAKKAKIQTRPAQRFWPDSLVPTQYNTVVPIAPNNLAVQARMPSTLQMQTLPGGTMSLPVAMSTLTNSSGTVTLPPGTVTLPPNFAIQQGSNIVIVTLPAHASTICTVTDSISASHSGATSSTATTQANAASRGDMSPLLVSVQHGSPALQSSPLPTMAHNGGMGSMGSPHHISTASNVVQVDNLVHTLALQNNDG
ncbi:homeobox protein PKNOX1 [Nematostella vectensis]|nr:homeobox protein PKNOX1 [Nematostella vectensis]